MMQTRVEINVSALPDLLGLLLADYAYWEAILREIRKGGLIAPAFAMENLPPSPYSDVLALRRAYRLDDIEACLRKLRLKGFHGRRLATAVDCEYVAPMREYEPERRAKWARVGVYWMARDIEGELVAFVPMRLLSREERIEGMLSRGAHYGEIAQAVRCSRREVASVSRAVRVRSESTADAGGCVSS